MQTTFITIHDLSDDARILYSSDSIVDVLGYTPDEVINRPTWDFFDASALPYAKKMHQRSVHLDKASVLAYCDIKNREGKLIRCECCFSVVFNVMVGCVSIYNQGMSGQRRRADAPIMRRLFSSSPKDPRYHMLQHLSARFSQDTLPQMNEPRAALFLNRFTRSLAIMYATSGIEQIIGISGEEMKGRSFYHCIAEACLLDAVNCLETAKSNDSLAYLRFMFRDPRQDDEPLDESDNTTERTESDFVSDTDMTDIDEQADFARPAPLVRHHHEPNEVARDSSTSSSSATPTFDGRNLELEAIISCTSDGLVVCLRRARTPVPHAIHDTATMNASQGASYTGYFAAPWADPPLYNPSRVLGYEKAAYPGMPEAAVEPQTVTPPASTTPSIDARDEGAFLRAIQECGVLAWGLVGINGSLADLAHGTPEGDSMPAEGPAVWAPSSASVNPDPAAESHAVGHNLSA